MRGERDRPCYAALLGPGESIPYPTCREKGEGSLQGSSMGSGQAVMTTDTLLPRTCIWASVP